MPQLKTTSKFRQAYAQLNPAQKQAVDKIDGPVMVIAGPGTGKTEVLTTRIANILLKTDTDPSAILALTFTDSAAKNMRQRLAKMIGKTAYYVNISTFHSFCANVIRQHPEYFPIQRDSEPLTGLERYEIYETLLDQTQLELLKPLNAPYFFVQDIVSAISDLKREGVLPDKFEQIIADEQQAFDHPQEKLTKVESRRQEKNLTKWRELLTLYRGYQQQLADRQRYDFDDMIALVVQAFQEQELLLLSYQEKLHYFLVDEYQDTNSAQNQVVDLLASYWGDKANIFTVGDPNQAIFRFQGASVENMLGFVDRYPRSTVINLDIGYRCPQTIYDAARTLIGHNQLSQADSTVKSPSSQSQAKIKLLKILNEPLQSATDPAGAQVKVFQAPVQTLETVYIVQQIKQLIKQGTDPAEIAVLYLYNRDADEISQALAKWSIRFEIDGGGDILQSELINQLFNFFQVLVDLRDSSEDELVFKLMHYDWVDLEPLAVMKLGRIAGKLKMSLLDVIDHGYSLLEEKGLAGLLTQTSFKKIESFVKDLYRWSSLDLAQTFPHWFELVITETGLLAWIQEQPNHLDLLNQLNTIYNQVKSLVSHDHNFKLKNFLQTINIMQEHRLKINAEDLNIKQQAVHLATVYKAKGQEWQHVFLLHCVDRKWGNKRQRNLLPLPEGILQNTDVSQKERNEDERRVFYVALTRASQSVTITYPETIVQDNRTANKSPSQFLLEIGPTKQLEDKKLLAQADQHLAKLIEPPPQRVPTNDEKQFFKNLVADFKLSVTALNSYLRDPQEFVENNLLRVPRAKPMPMSFGTAVHSALEKLYRRYLLTGELPDQQFLLTKFEQALKKEILTEADFKQRLKHGQKILANYHEKTAAKPLPAVVEVERSVGYGWSTAILDHDIALTGKLDRIDWVDRTKKLVRVVDYKTGKPKTNGYIEGTLKSLPLSEREQALPEIIRGPYKRQLIFYKLLTELDRSFNATTVEGMFEFVEPYDKRTGKLMPRNFVITKDEVRALKDLIREVMKEIRGLEFLKTI